MCTDRCNFLIVCPELSSCHACLKSQFQKCGPWDTLSCVLFASRLQSLRPPTEVPNAQHWKQPKNSRKGCRVGHGKAAGKTDGNSRNTRKTAVLTVFRVFRLFFQLFSGCFTMTHSAPFSAVFRLFSTSGIWHLCRWQQRLQHQGRIGPSKPSQAVRHEAAKRTRA